MRIYIIRNRMEEEEEEEEEDKTMMEWEKRPGEYPPAPPDTLTIN
jgi:hypothetical protein